ncbi:MAG: hypothetical protein AAFN78_05930 [Pseudomonadota bacterium]
MRTRTLWMVLGGLALSMNTAMAVDSFDSDGDGYDDNEDNCTLTFNPLQRDTDGDYYGNMCDGDFTGDFVINFEDLGVMKSNFFVAGDTDTDLNGDGATNFSDLAVLKGLFFTNPGPTGADPEMPPCTCYFSRDCNAFYGGGFCDYGGPFTEETNCFWRDVKPDENAGIEGCSTEVEIPSWVANICDGVCNDSRNGSSSGLEDTALVSQAVMLWADSMLQPSIAGGGPVDDNIANVAMALPFQRDGISGSLGRHTADLLALVSGEGFYDYFCHWEGHPGEEGPVVDIQGDTCSIRAAEITMQALTAEMAEAGTGAPLIAGIASVCPDWQTRFAPRCEAGPNALECVRDTVADLAYFLSTPPINSVPESLDSMLRGAMR